MNADERGYTQIKTKIGLFLSASIRFHLRPLILLSLLNLSATAEAGVYVPLKLSASAAGTVNVSGKAVQGVEWPAPGVAGVTLPVMVYGDTAEVDVDGKPTPLDAPSADELTAFRQLIGDDTAVTYDEDAYQQAAAWTPGRSAAQRRWTLTAVGVIVLVLAVARHADPKRATLWLSIAGVGLAAGVFWLFPADTPRRVLPAAGRPEWEWVWRAGERTAVREPWSAGLRYVPRSEHGVAVASPVLECDAAGKPVAIRVRLGPNDRAVFLRKTLTHVRGEPFRRERE